MKYRIKDIRIAKGWTQQQLADRVGTSKGHISDIEKDKRNPSTTMLAAIAEALQVPVQELYRTDNPQDARAIAHFAMFLELAPDDQEAVSRHTRGLLRKDD